VDDASIVREQIVSRTQNSREHASRGRLVALIEPSVNDNQAAQRKAAGEQKQIEHGPFLPDIEGA
jgi:hypothetical protein